MSYAVSTVLNSNPETLSTAAKEAGDGALRVGENMTTQRKLLDEMRNDWSGTASEAAQKQGADMLTDQGAYQKKLEDVQKALSGGAGKLRDLRSDLQRAVDDAEVWWNVADDGSVTPGFVLSAWAAMSKVNWFEVENRRIAVEQTIKLILAKFEAADEHTANEVRKVGWR